MRLAAYLRQTVSWERRTGEDEWGDAQYDPPVILPARINRREKVIKSKDDTDRPSRTLVMTEKEVFLLDRLNGLVVEAREDIVDKRGQIIGWKLFLEAPQGF